MAITLKKTDKFDKRNASDDIYAPLSYMKLQNRIAKLHPIDPIT